MLRECLKVGVFRVQEFGCTVHRELCVDNILVRIPFIIVMIRWRRGSLTSFSQVAKFLFTGSLISAFLVFGGGESCGVRGGGSRIQSLEVWLCGSGV